MKHIGTQTIETERLILRRFKVEDAKEVFDNYASHEVVTEFLSWYPHKNVEETKDFLNLVISSYEKPERYCWALVLKETNQVVGSIDVVSQNDARCRAELGWVLGDEFWGKGLMPEAGKKIVELLFGLGYRRIEAKHRIENPKSGRVMEKIGMTYEGILKKYGKDREGNFVDLKMWSIVR